jgi:hypothetical protein
VAIAGGVVTYREVSDLVGLDPRDPAQRTELSQMLRAVSLHEHQQGRPLLSAVVVSQDTGIPGSGFFTLLRSLGVYGSDEHSLFRQELQRVHDHWANAAVPT